MDHFEGGNYPVKRPAFLTVLCVLTFVGSGWALFSAVTAFNTAKNTVGIFSDSLRINKEISRGKADTLIIAKSDTFVRNQNIPGSLKDSLAGSIILEDSVRRQYEGDTLSKAEQMEMRFGEKIKKSVHDMMSVNKLKNSAIGSFVAALFTLAGAFFMWRLRKYGFFMYILGIAIGIIVPFYIYGNNLLAIGISAFSSFIGLLFIALYALNLKSMK